MSEEQDGRPAEPLLTDERLRRRSRQRKSVYAKPMRKTRVITAVIFLLVLVGGAVYYQTYLTARYAIVLNGKPLVALTTREQCDAAILQLKKKYAPYVPQVVHFVEGELATEPLKQSMATSTVPQAVEKLSQQVTVRFEGVGIFVNGSPKALLATKADAVTALGLLQQAGLGNRTGTPTFRETVRIAPYKQMIEPEKPLVPMLTPEQAARELYHPPRPRYATVERGGSFYAIAVAHGLTVEQIKQLNPKLNPQALQPGDRVRLPDETAPISIVVR